MENRMAQAETQRMPSWKTMLRLVPYLKRQRLWAGLTVLFSATYAFVRIGVAYYMKVMTDAAVAGQSDTFLRLLVQSSGLLGFDLAMYYVWTHVEARFTAYLMRDLRDRIAEHVQRMPLSAVERYHSGDLVTRLMGHVPGIADYALFVAQFIYQPLILIASVVFIASINWKMLLVFVTITPLSAPLYAWISRPMQDLSKRVKADQAEAGALVEDTLRGSAVVKAFGLEDALAERYRRMALSLQRTQMQVQGLNVHLRLVGQVLRYLPMLGTVLLGGYLAYRGETTVGAVMAISTAMRWCTAGPIEALLGLLRRTRETLPVVERVLDVLDQPAEPADGASLPKREGHPALSFCGVSFSYDGEGPVLDEVSFDVGEGEVVALVGASGSGKSTILRLLCGFYEAQGGTVHVFGHWLRGPNLTRARNWISIVTQDTCLLPLTVSENIGWGKLGATRDEIVASAQRANVDRFVAQLPAGYETVLDEEAVNLSGGERQCIAIARAVLKDAPILLLDEPTAALDARSEAMVQDALDRFAEGRTVLLVAHRLATIRNVDRILVLGQGRICEEGTHEELMGTDSLYRRLYIKQLDESSTVRVTASGSRA
jgi:subfamily B ATP-binding cassette protein MsbA/ATP-binding cassette subfamily B protein AbcA/BmrA